MTGQAVQLKTEREVLDDPQYLACETAEEERSRHRGYDADFINRYVEGEAQILIVFQCGKSAEFIACLHRDDWRDIRSTSEYHLLEVMSRRADDRSSTTKRSAFAWRHAAAHRYSSDRKNQTMLVHDVKLMQLPKMVAPPSLVWLDTVEQMVAILPDAWYLSARQGWKVFGSIRNWERRILLWDDPGRAHKSIGQVIQGASQIVDSIPQHESEFFRDGRDALNVIDQISRLVVEFSPDGVRILQPESLNSGFKITDTLLGPIIFR